MKITATNKATGEVVDLPANTPEEIVIAWQIAQEYEKTSTALKDQLKNLLASLVNERAISGPLKNAQFRITTIQRMTYDKATMRQLISDEDFLDTLLKPDKPLIDKLLK